MADQQAREFFNELKSKYDTLIMLGSDFKSSDVAMEWISGLPVDIAYMLGHALGTFCKGRGAENIKLIFNYFQAGIHDAYEGGNHDQNNKD